MKASAGLRYEGALARHGHVESWFLKANDPHSRRAVWLKWTVWAGDRAPTAAIAEAWAVAFSAKSGHVAAKMAVPFGGGLTRFAAMAWASQSTGAPSRASGSRESGDGRASDRIRSPHRAAGRAVAPLPELLDVRPPLARAEARVAHSERARLGASRCRRGRVGRDGWPAMVGHNWGEPALLPVRLGALQRVGRRRRPGLRGRFDRAVADPCWAAPSCAFVHEGMRHNLNGLRRSHAMAARSPLVGGASEGDRRVSRSRVRCGPTRTISLVSCIQTPTGTNCHCLNSKLARTEVTLKFAGRPPRTSQSARGALEIGTSDPNHGVRMVL